MFDDLYVDLTIPEEWVDGWAEDLTEAEVEALVKRIVNQCATEFEARLGPQPEEHAINPLLIRGVW